MKKCILLLWVMLFTGNLFSQDKIILKRGKEIECKITKEDSVSVSFTFISNDKEVTTYISKAEVQEIIYANKVVAQGKSTRIEIVPVFGGNKFILNGEVLTLERLENIVEPNAAAYQEIKSIRPTFSLVMVLSAVGGGLIGWPIGTSLGGGEPNWTLAAIGVGCCAIAIPVSINLDNKLKHAVELYNSGLSSACYEKKNAIEFKIQIRPNALGLCFNF
jgi:hypothetical protein